MALDIVTVDKGMNRPARRRSPVRRLIGRVGLVLIVLVVAALATGLLKIDLIP